MTGRKSAILIFFLVVFVSGVSGDEPDSGRSPMPDLGRMMFPENWVDFVGQPCPVGLGNYAADLAGRTIAPTTVEIDDKVIKVGMKDANLKILLDTLYRISDSSIKRTERENDQFLSDLLRANPFTMHYYILYGLTGRSGWFETVACDFSNCAKIKISLHASTEKGIYRVYLIHVNLPPIEASDVSLKKVENHLTAIRKSVPPAVWNIDKNTLKVTCD
ncbi:hypothetical protein TRIP_C20769 [Candidatus Zixiibacteriota bacterium]|nr:hypothetical protein TRIP_C20769 [candidate division Zixibacteria bacterium]